MEIRTFIISLDNQWINVWASARGGIL
jgi:hypothetical protein